MDRDHSRSNVWPNRQYDGGDRYEEYVVDKDTWIIEKGYKKHLATRDPSSISRCRQAYTVSTDDDPRGPRGTRVRYERQEDYDKRCERWLEEDEKLWAKIMRGYCGAARATALRAPRSAQALLDLIQQEHGDKSDKQVSTLVRTFVTRQKGHKKSIKEYNQEWEDAVRVMKAHGMDLPAPFVLHLYLYSLGSSYRTLEAVASVLPPAQRTLSHVMRLAVDHSAPDYEDEAQNHTALIAELKTEVENLKKRNAEQAFGAFRSALPVCTNCGKPGHTIKECFAPGGHLAHYTQQQRNDHIDKMRKHREQKKQPKQQPKETAATVIDERDYKIKRLQEQIQELGYVPAVLPDSDDDGQDPSNFNL